MRFRAKAGSEQFQFLADVIQHVHRISDDCLIKFSPNAIHIAANENQSGTGDGLPLFAKLMPLELFFDYRIEARAENKIMVSMKPSHMLRASRALKDAPEVTISLTKKRGLAKLTLTARDSRGVDYVQDVPVSVRGADEHDRTNDPVLDTPEKIVIIHDAAALRTVVDKMKHFDKYAVVKAAQLDPADQQKQGEGWLRLMTATSIVEVETRFDSMEVKMPQHQARRNRKRKRNEGAGDAKAGAKSDDAEEGNADVDPMSGQAPSVVKVAVKQLSQAMATTTVRNESVAFCISSDYFLILYIKLHNSAGHMTLYLQGLEREFDASEEEMELAGDDEGEV